MPPGRPRYAKRDRDSYVFNRPAPPLATLPRATEELILACRIFSPGFNELAELDQKASNVFYAIENGMCEELMKNLGITSTRELREICKKSYAVYATEIKRMDDAEKAEAARLAKELAAREAAEQAQAEKQKSTEGLRQDNDEKKKAAEQQQAARQDNNQASNKRQAEADVSTASAASSASKRPRHDRANDMIPDPYWLSKEDAQAALTAMRNRSESLKRTLTRLENFYVDTFVTPGLTSDSTISDLMIGLDNQLRRDIPLYVDELHHVMAGGAVPEINFAADSNMVWKRNRFGNVRVRELIERIRELGTRLVDIEKEMDPADRLHAKFVRGCEEGGEVSEAARKVFLEEWAKLLELVVLAGKYDAKDFVSFITMELEWKEKWAKKDEGEVVEKDGNSVIVISSSDEDDDSDEDSEEDDSEEDGSDEDGLDEDGSEEDGLEEDDSEEVESEED